MPGSHKLTLVAQVAGVAWTEVGPGSRLRRHPVASRREVGAQDELALETALLETAVCLGDLIEGDPLAEAWPDGASSQQAKEPLQVLPAPGGMSRPHHVD